ncbi:MAG: hypothetical protein ACYTA3_11220 [Planctomycetota bacterium]|jgi:hypothetical protein
MREQPTALPGSNPVVIAGVKQDWTSRLAHLNGLVEAGARGPMWLWRIRIRILSYLLARYGEPPRAVPREIEAGRQDAEDDLLGSPEPLPPVFVATTRPSVGVEHPPKPGTVITPILADLHEVNTEVRLARWQDPPPDQVWTWWQSVWCREP